MCGLLLYISFSIAYISFSSCHRKISTQHAVLLSSTSVTAMSKAPNILLSVDYLSFSPSNRQGPIIVFTIAYFSFSLSQGMIIKYYQVLIGSASVLAMDGVNLLHHPTASNIIKMVHHHPIVSNTICYHPHTRMNLSSLCDIFHLTLKHPTF